MLTCRSCHVVGCKKKSRGPRWRCATGCYCRLSALKLVPLPRLLFTQRPWVSAAVLKELTRFSPGSKTGCLLLTEVPTLAPSTSLYIRVTSAILRQDRWARYVQDRRAHSSEIWTWLHLKYSRAPKCTLCHHTNYDSNWHAVTKANIIRVHLRHAAEAAKQKS
jgi:hypothetical protein